MTRSEFFLVAFTQLYKSLCRCVHRSVSPSQSAKNEVSKDIEDMDEDFPEEEHDTEKELDTMYMGTESKARRRFQRTGFPGFQV